MLCHHNYPHIHVLYIVNFDGDFEGDPSGSPSKNDTVDAGC